MVVVGCSRSTRVSTAGCAPRHRRARCERPLRRRRAVVRAVVGFAGQRARSVPDRVPDRESLSVDNLFSLACSLLRRSARAPDRCCSGASSARSHAGAVTRRVPDPTTFLADLPARCWIATGAKLGLSRREVHPEAPDRALGEPVLPRPSYHGDRSRPPGGRRRFTPLALCCRVESTDLDVRGRSVPAVLAVSRRRVRSTVELFRSRLRALLDFVGVLAGCASWRPGADP